MHKIRKIVSAWPLKFIRAGLIGCVAIGAPSIAQPHDAAKPKTLNQDGSRTKPLSIWRTVFARPKTIPAPPENPITPEKIKLGEHLFHDPRLSGDETRSCASCHNSRTGFSNGQKTPQGKNSAPLRRNAPHLWNLAWSPSLYWDGRQPTLEAQARIPIEHQNEMGGRWPKIIAGLSADPDIAAQFQRAFPDQPAITQSNILKAIATYERSLISPITRFDRWIDGDNAALSDTERTGFSVFIQAGCVGCHSGWRFTDDRFHDIGRPDADLGRAHLTNFKSGPQHTFKTPGLRDLAHTQPYMHDGSLATLADVLDHYTQIAVQRPSLSPLLVRPLSLSTNDRQALIEFLGTLSSDQ